jgi:transposase
MASFSPAAWPLKEEVMSEFQGLSQLLASLAPPAQAPPPCAQDSGASAADLSQSSPAEGAAVNDNDQAFEEPPIAEVQERSFQRTKRGAGAKRGKRLVKPEEGKSQPFTPPQRLLVLDSWQRSGLPAGDFAALVGVSKHTLYAWKKAFQTHGPAGLMDQPRGAKQGSRLPELTKRAILMLKEANPDWGCQRISDALLRGPALPASPSSVARVLHEAGYQLEESPTRPHPRAARAAACGARLSLGRAARPLGPSGGRVLGDLPANAAALAAQVALSGRQTGSPPLWAAGEPLLPGGPRTSLDALATNGA